MTEHKKIPLPGDKDGNVPSLLERASGAFALDGLGGAPVPKDLPDAPMKRAKPVRKKSAARNDTPPAEQNAEPEAALEANLPVPAEAREITVLQPAIKRFTTDGYNVDRELLQDHGLIVPEHGNSALFEEFRIVKRQVLRAARAADTPDARRILISSPWPDEGKTFCAINLAIALASERDVEVLLADADFANPSVLERLGIPLRPGFMDALADPKMPPEDLVIGTDIKNLWVLPAGNRTNSDSEFLASERTAEVLDRFTVGAPNRFVIFDTPPALSASPAAELAKHVGQAILVVRADETGHTALEDAYQLLSACQDIKLLFNAAQFSPSGRRFGSYYGEGE